MFVFLSEGEGVHLGFILMDGSGVSGTLGSDTLHGPWIQAQL